VKSEAVGETRTAIKSRRRKECGGEEVGSELNITMSKTCAKKGAWGVTAGLRRRMDGLFSQGIVV